MFLETPLPQQVITCLIDVHIVNGMKANLLIGTVDILGLEHLGSTRLSEQQSSAKECQTPDHRHIPSTMTVIS